MGDRSTCQHEHFSAVVNVGRLTEKDGGPATRFCADVTIRCVDCGEPFRFIGVNAGFDFERPTVSLDGLELHAPIEPELVKMFHQRLVYRMPPEERT